MTVEVQGLIEESVTPNGGAASASGHGDSVGDSSRESQESLSETARNSEARDCPSSAPSPSEEPGPAKPEHVSVLSLLRGRGRRADGTAGPGNTLALRHGLRSERLFENPDMVLAHREMVDAIAVDLGGADALSAIEARLVREFARASIIAESLGINVLEHGTLSGKGKTRAAVKTYLQVLDRLVRLGPTLGLKRRIRRASSLAELAGQLAQDRHIAATNDEEQQHGTDSDNKHAGDGANPDEEAARDHTRAPV